MTLPPERITIKRRREDEPVEALYIEQKRHCSTSAYWVRVRGGKPDDTAAISSPRGYLSSVIRGSNHAGPEIQDRLRSKDATPSSSGQIVQNTQDGTQGAQGADGSEERSTRPVPFEPGKTMRDKKRSSMWPRTFHLSAGSKSLSSHSMVSSHGIRKSRSGRRDLAVFEEKIKTARDLGVLNAEYQKGTDLSGQGTGMSRAAEGNHRNPKAQAVASIGGELLVAECAPEAPGGDKAILRSRKVEEVLERLPQAASDKTHTGTINDAPLQPQIKFQPQPSKARRDENPTGFGALGHLPDAEDPESQDDFVYDTYLRTKQPMVGSQPGCPMDIDQLEGIADGKVGILVIAEQDEAVWEAYAEEEESDKDWNSEEEDENAEDFYGNDYPEDEVDSDDEYGRGAYQYRSHASDEEEFDEDRHNWSNDEDEVAYYGSMRVGTINVMP